MAQIIGGSTPIQVGGLTYEVRQASREARCRAAQIFAESYAAAREAGVLSEDEILCWMIDKDYWSIADEERLQRMQEEVSEIKVKIYELFLQSTEREMYRAALGETRKSIDILLSKKHAFSYLTDTAVAGSAKLRFLVGASLHRNGKPHWTSFSRWAKPDHVVSNAVAAYSRFFVSEADIRELSRNDPWRSIWAASKSSGRGAFDVAACDLTDLQKNLILFSRMMDNIYESPDNPGDLVIEDDDALDGWLILQRRKSDEETTRNSILGRLDNEKIRNSQEVFIAVSNEKEAKIVQSINDTGAMVAFKSRMLQIKKEGTVKEEDMWETRQRVLMELNAAAQRA